MCGVGYFLFLWLGNSILELAISPSFFRPIFFCIFLKVERKAGSAFGDTAVQRNCYGPHIAEGLPLRAGGKAWCVSGLGGTGGFSEGAATMESIFPRCNEGGPGLGGPWLFEEALAAGPRRADVGLAGKSDKPFGESAAEGSARAGGVGGASAAS